MKLTHMFTHNTSRALGAFALVALTQSASAASLWTAGHGDFGVGFDPDEGEFEFGWHLGEDGDFAIVDGANVGSAEGSEFEADELVVVVNNQLASAPLAQALRDGSGITIGGSDTLHLVDQAANITPALPLHLIGVGTEELDATEFGDVTFTLENVVGPGFFSLYTATSPTNFDFAFSTADGIDATDTFTFGAGGHSEFSWGFTETGSYEVEVTAQTIRFEGNVGGTEQIFTSTETFTFNVIPEPTSTLLIGVSTLGLLRRRRA